MLILNILNLNYDILFKINSINFGFISRLSPIYIFPFLRAIMIHLEIKVKEGAHFDLTMVNIYVKRRQRSRVRYHLGGKSHD